MSTELKPFLFESKQVRIVPDERGDPWFVAADICRVLELPDVTRALRGLDDDERGTTVAEKWDGVGDKLSGRNTAVSMNTISEPGLYKLLARSHKPEAKRFDRWVRHEVLPSIRKTGAYQLPDARQIGGIVKAVVGKQIDHLEGEIGRLVARMNTLVIEHDSRVAAVEYRPMLAILLEQKVAPCKRRALSSRCSGLLRRYCAERAIPIRISPESGRYLFHVDAARDWLHGAGQQIIAAHIASVSGQSVLNFRRPA